MDQSEVTHAPIRGEIIPESQPLSTDLNSTPSDLHHVPDDDQSHQICKPLENLNLKEFVNEHNQTETATELENQVSNGGRDTMSGNESSEVDGEKSKALEKSGSNGEEETERYENSEEVDNVSGNETEGIKYLYPLRPEAEDCAYFMKTGNCKYGHNCKFNHPVRRKKPIRKGKDKEKIDFPQNLNLTQCKYYNWTGGCKYGKACRYNHTDEKSSVDASKLNFLGLPIRPGEQECQFYMRSGACKFGVNCKFSHPNPTTTEEPSGYGEGVYTGSVSWSSSWDATEPTLTYPSSQRHPSQTQEWSGYQAPVHPSPTSYLFNNPATETSAYKQYDRQIPVDEYPERPGQPECNHFIKTGDCKYKSTCKYHHPKNRRPIPPPCFLNDQGLPLRPDKDLCNHYSRYGICKFGPGCKFDHSIQQLSDVSQLDQPDATFGKEVGLIVINSE